MKLVQIVLLIGSQCVSPVEHHEGLTDVSKVPCAVIIRTDDETNDVTTLPPDAAGHPEVRTRIAGLVPDPIPVPASAPPPTQTVQPHPPAKPAKKTASIFSRKAPEKRAAAVRPPQKPARLADRCGSWRAVWYTAKNGHRKYRCVPRA